MCRRFGFGLFLLVLGIFFTKSGSENVDPLPVNYEPSWLYKCVPDEGCHRLEAPRGDGGHPNGTHFQSLSLCRTVCGRFGAIWPRPISAALSTQTIEIHPNNFRFDLVEVPAGARDMLAKMTRVISNNLLKECPGNVTTYVDTPVVIYFSITNDSLSLTWDTKEDYILDVQTKAQKVVVHINADTVYGARHAMESFSQLISPDTDEQADKCTLRLVSGAKIRDRPAYPHRGFMLDTSRNFIPMQDIRRMIDGMAATKMNVFHWHVTDSHSFPLECPRVPQFTRYGAYSPAEIYSAEEVRQLVDYAQVRGIRVVVEIDAPAHVGNGWQWGKKYDLGDLAVCVNAQPWRNLCIQPPCGQLNVANPNVYVVLGNLYRDLADMLPRPTLLHVGGDEIFMNCWNHTEEIRNFMKNNNMSLTMDGFMELWSQFQKKSLQLWDEIQATAGETVKQPVMIWSSDLTYSQRIQRYLDPNRYVIEVWDNKDDSQLQQLLRLGYRAVSVPRDIWYLDHGFWGQTKYSNWRRMYGHTLPEHRNLLGGEVAMWTEYVDSTGLDARVWPRTAAVAERLWSAPAGAAAGAEPRLQRLRERLLARGLRPDVLSPGWCAQHDSKCL